MRSCECPGYYDVSFEQRRKASAHLWENEESLRKYLNHLRDLMMADPDSRMTEDETSEAARIRAELYNSGLRGKELIIKLEERLTKYMSESDDKPPGPSYPSPKADP